MSPLLQPRTPPFPPGDPARLVVMISGGGRTLAYLAAAVKEGRLNARLVGVVSSTPDGSEGFAKAESFGLPVEHLPGHPTAAALEQTVMKWRPDYVVLAGYLKKLEVPASLAGRIVNIHPALLPAFGGKGLYGRRVHEAVLAGGVRESGCTVHMVDDEYDHGQVLLQRSCPVLPGDTPETLAARVFIEEQAAYVEALCGLVRGTINTEAAR